MTDSDNILTATLAELKTYFEGWHTSNYDKLHTGISSSISSLQEEIDNIKNTIIDNKITEALRNYYNKDQSDERYLLGYPTNKIKNSSYSDENLKIQTNKKNKEAIVNENEAGLVTPNMYETLLQLSDPKNAKGATAMNEKAGHDTYGKWKKTNPVFVNDTIGVVPNSSYEDGFTEYLYHFGYFTQMTRFGAMRTLTMLYQAYDDVPNEAPDKLRRICTFLGLDDRWSHRDGTGHRYYLVTRIAEEDAPLVNSMFIDVDDSVNLSFTTLPESPGLPGHHHYQMYDGNYNDEVEAGTWLVVSGGKVQAPGIKNLFILGSITWIAKNTKE